ncbi:hypothetical protein SAMN05421766_101878 [Zobellia uliginosa]|uniref:Uncharacterized protein n=1 Tax=Zobellia uliginosa TaxID=143224 RepID=A0ABY1KJU6_9FLAO|nr:hypothetical protein [Zobellia uliginosa]SIS42693.1 hypothetical protein SAMN05421766_101878 [Zobellia uliginosa]
MIAKIRISDNYLIVQIGLAQSIELGEAMSLKLQMNLQTIGDTLSIALLIDKLHV